MEKDLEKLVENVLNEEIQFGLAATEIYEKMRRLLQHHTNLDIKGNTLVDGNGDVVFRLEVNGTAGVFVTVYAAGHGTKRVMIKAWDQKLLTTFIEKCVKIIDTHADKVNALTKPTIKQLEDALHVIGSELNDYI